MPTTICFAFPGGRYHATPTGHHVNEGLIEWPPSPWRIIRALIASGYTKLGWDVIPATAGRLCKLLSSELPTYRLPPAAAAHSRHYMPLGVLDKGREKTTLVFDTWADVADGVLSVTWPFDLESDQRALLNRLLENLSYLGRSESWVDARLLADTDEAPPGNPCWPHIDGQGPEADHEQIALMAPEQPEVFQTWRDGRVDQALADLALPASGKKIPKKLATDRAKAMAPFPVDLVDALQWDTARWKHHRWNHPPGCRRALYWRRADALDIARPTAARPATDHRVACMLLALTTPSGRRGGLPPVTRALPQGELLHRTLIGLAGGGAAVDCSELTGKDASGAPLCGHRHASILPLDLDGDGHLDHILIHAPMGLGPLAQQAIRSCRRTHTKGAADLQVAIAALGELDDLRQLPPPLATGIERLLGAALQGSAIWHSVSPFVPPRYVKPRGRNSLEGQLMAELESRGRPAPQAIERIPFTHDHARSLRHHVRTRGGKAPQPPMNAGFVFRLTFAEPITGPLTLGYASHFGLGLFTAET